jgi:hypothetical protein
MDTVKDLPKDGRPVTLVTTGDGTSEFRRLAAFSKSYDGKKVFWFPEQLKYLPIRRRSKAKTNKKSGLGPLRILNLYPGKYALFKYLFIIDREYFGTDPIKDLLSELEGLGITVNSHERLNTGSFYVSCKSGAHELVVYLAISGKIKCIEEDFAELIKLEYPEEPIVDSTKRGIGKIFREKGLKDTQLIKNAKKTNLRKAFPNLNSALMKIKENNAES